MEIKQVIEFSCDLVVNGKTVEEVRDDLSFLLRTGQPLPKGARVLDIEDLLSELTEDDPEFYFMPPMYRGDQ